MVRKKLNQTQLKKKYSNLFRLLVLERDNYTCQIQGYRHVCSDVLQADHRPAKRGTSATFFDIRNLTCVCSTANMRAERDHFIATAISNHVKNREGFEYYNQLEWLSRPGNPKSIVKWTEESILELYKKTKESL